MVQKKTPKSIHFLISEDSENQQAEQMVEQRMWFLLDGLND